MLQKNLTFSKIYVDQEKIFTKVSWEGRNI